MRPRPSHLFFLCTISLAKAAVFDRGDLSRRNGLLDEVRQMFGGEGRARETVTETIRQTITVNGAGSQGAFNATATETVTVPVNVASSAVEDDEGGQRNADEFEGFRISFVTQTVVATQQPSTTTIVEKASTNTVFETIPASTVTEQAPAETIVQTVTESCAGGNPPVNTTGTPLMQTPTAPDVVIKPGPNGDGNGIGVTTVPIPVSALPRTTLTYDPLATPGIGTTSAPAGLPATTSSSTPLEPQPSTLESPTAGEQPPAAEEPAASPKPTAAPAEPETTEKDVTPTETAEEPAGTGDDGADDSDDSDDSGDSDNGDESDSDDSEDDDGGGDDDGEDGPDPSAPADSVVTTSDPVVATISRAPVLPSVDLSSFSLDSQLNLGNLIPQTEPPGAQPSDAP